MDLFNPELLKKDRKRVERVREWIKALRSGEYEQAQHRLRFNDAFCCLGVACDLVGRRWEDSGAGFYAVRDRGHWRDDVLPVGVRLAFGLNEMGGGFEYEGDSRSLAGMNDEGKTFAEIADIIESELNLALGVAA